MINIYNICAKPCGNLVAKLVQNFVDIITNNIFVCKTHFCSHFLPTFSHLFSHNFLIDNHLNTFPLFHRPYYYHYYIKNNINNRKD